MASLSHLTPTCLGARSSSSAVTTAVVALLFSAMGCRVTDSPATTWTVKSVRDTLSSSTVTVFSAKMESDSGDNTCGDSGSTEEPSCPFPGIGTCVKIPYSPLDGPEMPNIDHKEAQASVTVIGSTLSLFKQPFPETLLPLVNRNNHKIIPF